jgi:predicted nuclease of predicted toxin-antitoxin system
MRLLFDNNISYRLSKRLLDIAPECLHVNRTGLASPAEDKEIWKWAKQNDYAIVTFDDDFEQLEILFGFPPKVILLRFGNTKSSSLESILRINWDFIQSFLEDNSSGLLELY